MNLNELRSNAKEMGRAGDFADEAPPNGTYNCQIVNANTGETTTGKISFGVLLEVLEGQHAATKFWANMYIGGNQSPTADQISFRELESLGIDDSYFKIYTDLTQAVEAVKGMVVSVKITRSQPSANGTVFVNTRFIPEKNGASANTQLAPQAPQPTAPTVPQPAPPSPAPAAPATAPAPPGWTPPGPALG